MSPTWRSQEWEPPSPPVAELIQATVSQLMDRPADLFATLDEAVIATNRRLLDIDPRLVDPLRAAARSNVIQWAAANLRAPGVPVPANLGKENTDFAVEVVRHGFDETILDGFRAGQNVAIEYFNERAFELTDDRDLLRELVQVATRSIFRYVDDTLEGLTEIIGRERSQLRDVAHAARLETVSLILAGAPIAVRRASERLGYGVDGPHVAAVLWADAAATGELEVVAAQVADAVGARRSLLLPVDTGALWLWLAGSAVPSAPALRERIRVPAGAFVALGRPGSGVDGFRSSHLEALSAQRLVRRLPRPAPVTTYDDVELIALAGHDEDHAREFIARTLGDLLDGPPELRETLATYLREDCNATRTAQVLFSHRNTVIARLDRARDLLPNPLDGRSLQVALALELAQVFRTEPRPSD